MAGTSLLALLDDIATILDDISVMTKVAAKKTVGLLGDDLALNAEQVSGIRAERELPVVWAVAKGSFKNKLILVPAALIISAFFPPLITLLLIMGGAFLCFEGFEKITHSFFDDADEVHHKKEETLQARRNPAIDLVSYESNKIKGAIRTDFILSAEIIVITLGTVQNAQLVEQIVVVSIIAMIMTVGVYALVACIVKMDDVGLLLADPTDTKGEDTFRKRVGRALLDLAPWLMKTLGVVGTAAMFLVGGGILIHSFSWLEHLTHAVSLSTNGSNPFSGLISAVATTAVTAVIGVIAGGLVFAVVRFVQKLRRTP